MFYRHFDDGEILPGRFAHQKDEETFHIFKQDEGTMEFMFAMEVKLGQHVKNAGNVTLDHNRNLKIGRHTVVVGNDPHQNWHALTTTSKTKFHIVRPDGYKSEYKVGDMIDSLGKLTQDEFGRIYLNDKNIPIRHKLYELNLIVLTTADGQGYSAFFNTLLPKDPNNRKNGIPGVFIQGSDSKPSKYQEKGPDGNYYTTAMIRPNSDGRTVRCIMRTLENAIEERVLVNDLEFRLQTEILPYDLDPEEDQEYMELKQRISENQTTMWMQREFAVTQGHRLLGLGNAPKKSLEPTR